MLFSPLKPFLLTNFSREQVIKETGAASGELKGPQSRYCELFLSFTKQQLNIKGNLKITV